MSKENLKSYARFFIKWRLLGPVRAFLIFMFGHKPNTAAWEERVLVVNLHALGDTVAMTSILRRYKMDFPRKTIYCLFPKDTGITEKLFGEFADKIILLDLKKFGLEPLYELDFLNSLRDIGFETVVNQGYAIFEIPSKIISINIGAKNIIGYEGLVIEYVNADWVMRRRISFIKKSIFPRYTKIVPILDRDFRARGRVMSFPRIYAAIYAALLGHTPKIMPTKIGIDPDAERSARALLEQRGVKLGTYGVFVIGGRTPVRWWPVDRFAEVARACSEAPYSTSKPIFPAARPSSLLGVGKATPSSGFGAFAAYSAEAASAAKAGRKSRHVATKEGFRTSSEINRSHVPIVLVGTRSEKEAASRFKELANVPVIDLVGELSVAELVSIINNCLFVLTNDTAPVHIAIALKKPSVCIMGGGIVGISDHYGYPRVNRWVYAKTDCFFDNWQCVKTVAPGGVAPCIAAVSAGKVIGELNDLLALIRQSGSEQFVKDENFEPEFESLL